MYESLHQIAGGFKNQFKISKTTGEEHLGTILSNQNINSFKVFVPPGAKNVAIYSHCGQGTGSAVYFTVRKDQQPSSNTVDKTVTFNDGFKITDLSQDCYGRNSAGYVFYVDDNAANTTIGFWVYVYIQAENTTILDTQLSYTIDVAQYQTWYNSATWGSDGDPLSTSSVTSGVLTREISLPPEAFKTMDVTFTPTEGKVYDSYITIKTNVGDFIYTVKGTGTSVPAVTTGTAGTGSGTSAAASVPIASLLVSEFYNYQDLDGNNLIYGYDFKIEDDSSIPPKKPIILCMIEKSPYWASPAKVIPWSSFVGGGGVSTSSSTTGSTTDAFVGGGNINNSSVVTGSIVDAFTGESTFSITSTDDSKYISLYQTNVNGIVGYRNFYSDFGSLVLLNNYYTLRTPGNQSFIPYFKLWIPPGIKSLSFYLSVGQNNILSKIKAGIIVRAGQPPTMNFPSEDEASVVSTAPSFSDILTDCIRREDSGYLWVCKENSFKNVTQGFWIFVKAKPYSVNISHIQSMLRVEKDIFESWFNNAVWLSNGDPSTGTNTESTTTVVTPTYNPIYGNSGSPFSGG